MTDELLQRLRSMEEESIRMGRTDVNQALAITEAMVQMAEGARPLARALALRAHCGILRSLNRLREALEASQAAQRLALEDGEEVEAARAVIGAIPILVRLGRDKEAIKAANGALHLLLGKGETAAAARLLNNMGALYGNMGRPLDALRCFTRGQELARESGQHDLSARFSANRAVGLQQVGRYEEALSASAAALRHMLRSGQRIAAARVLQNGAVSLFHLGRFGKALRRFARAREQFASQSAPRDVAVCDLYIAACYLELNRYDQTLSRLDSVAEALDPSHSGFQLAWAQLYRGVALARTGRPAEAHVAMAEARHWFEQKGYSAWAGRAWLEEADLLLAEGRHEEATRAATAAARLFKAAHMPVEEARAFLLVADSSLLAGRLRKAKLAIDRAYPTFARAHMPGPLFRTMAVRGRIALHSGKWEEARRYLTRAVATAERVRDTVQVAFRRTFLEDKAAAYADLVWLHLQRGRIRQAHQLADRAKSRTLADILSAQPDQALSKGNVDRSLLAHMESLRREYQALLTPARLGPEEAIFLRGGAMTAAARRAELERELATLWDEWELRLASASITGGRGGASGAAHRRLSVGSCMVEYFVAAEHIAAFVSDRRGLRGWVDLGPVAPVRRCLDLLRLNLDAALVSAATGRPTPPGLARNARNLLGELHRVLWQPLVSLFGHRRRFVVIPHEALHLVPFEALFDGQRYLVQEAELYFAPSRAAWLRCLDRTVTGGDLVMGSDLGGALPYVNEEASWVASALGTSPHTGQNAASSMLASGHYRIVHLAVHGEFRPENPHFSTLLLGDGPLTVVDAARSGLQASLVVLSGCETGLSRITRGEEQMGMIAAFLEAGSASVLASRWRVEDQVTARLMQQFYAGLLQGKTKATALREAQASLAAEDKHPLYWAAFSLVGNGDPVEVGS